MGSLRTLGAIVEYMKSLGPQDTAFPAAGQAAVSDVDLQALMLEVVAEKTGYPADMLNLGMDLEGDLGIDSIKRVEILSAVADQAPELRSVDMGHMGSLRTLGAIVEYMKGLGQPGLAAPAATPVAAPAAGFAAASGAASVAPAPAVASANVTDAANAAKAVPHLGRFVLERIVAPTTGLAQPGLLGGGEVWVTGLEELNEPLAAELRARGVGAKATSILPSGATACVYLGGLREVEDADAAIAVNREAFALARTLAGRLEKERGLFVTVQDTGAAFGTAPMDPRREWLAGLPALVKTAGQEWPQASLKAVDLERGGRGAEALAKALATELLEGGGEAEVALPASGGRFTLRSVERTVAPGAPVIVPGDVVVVSGGARGVTAACIEEWARESRARFVLLGRTSLAAEAACCAGVADEAGLKKALLAEARSQGLSPAPAELGARVHEVLSNREIRRTLAAIQAAGGEARYEAVSVEDAGALRAVLARVRADWGPVAGLVHAAGVLADRKISEKTDGQFDRVFDTKVKGLLALLRNLGRSAEAPLRLLVRLGPLRQQRPGRLRHGKRGPGEGRVGRVPPPPGDAREVVRVGTLGGRDGHAPAEGAVRVARRPDDPARRRRPNVRRRNSRSAAGGSGARPRGGAEGGSVLCAAPGPGPGARAEGRAAEPPVSRGASDGTGTPVVPVVSRGRVALARGRSFRPGLALAALHDIKVLKGIRLGAVRQRRATDFVIQARAASEHPGGPAPARRPELRRHRTTTAPAPSCSWSSRRRSRTLPRWSWGVVGRADLPGDLSSTGGAFELIQQVDGISDHGAEAGCAASRPAGRTARRTPGSSMWQPSTAGCRSSS